MNTPFKAPFARSAKKTNDQYYSSKSDRSDSDESVTSESSTGSYNDLTIVAMFDDLMRLMKQRRDAQVEDAFKLFAEEMKNLCDRCIDIENDRERLRSMLDLKTQECSETERRLNTARHILDEEKRKTHKVLRENQHLQEQLEQVRELLCKDTKIPQETKEQLNKQWNTCNINSGAKNLSCIQEINSTGSMLSDFSVSRSEDDLDVSMSNGKKQWNRQRPSTGVDADPPTKKRKSSSNCIEIGVSDTVRTTTTVTVSKKGPITAKSVIESIPNSDKAKCSSTPSSDDGIGSTAPCGPPPQIVFESWSRTDSPRANFRLQRQHVLEQKILLGSDLCVCCGKRVRFGRTALRCKDCKSSCHPECSGKLPLPCVPVAGTPNHKNILGIISDYTPTLPPMVPAIIIHCTNEIELRGLKELGLYRLSASEKDVKGLKEKFLKGRGPPPVTQIDIHVLCGCVKDFLRSLNEPLVTFHLWPDFVASVEARDVVAALCNCVAQLPQPNRDTLAYMILHLQKVAQAPECKMPIDNLAKVFGPTIIGFSSENPNTENLMTETRKQISVMEQLIRLSTDYWEKFVNVASQESASKLQQTPSTDSLLRPNGGYFSSASKSLRKRKYFNTPPSYK